MSLHSSEAERNHEICKIILKYAKGLSMKSLVMGITEGTNYTYDQVMFQCLALAYNNYVCLKNGKVYARVGD